MRPLARLLPLVVPALAGCRPYGPTFAELDRNVFARGCATSGCHAAQSPAGGLDLTDGKGYAALVGVAPANEKARAQGMLRVAPGDPTKSFLFVKCAGGALDADLGTRMPPLGDALDEDAAWALETWIRSGAKND